MKMVEIRNKIARFIAPEYFQDFDRKVNQRLAELSMKQDPFEILSREFNGIFSNEYEHLEEGLDERARNASCMDASVVATPETDKYPRYSGNL